MTTQTERMREALERIADPRNTHFAGDAQVVAREALAPAPEQGDTHHWPQQGDTTWPDAPEQQAPQMADPIPSNISADLERSDWTPEEALRWYAAGKHYDTVGGRARILDNGAVASNALKSLSLEYAKHKGDVALLEATTPPQAEQAEAAKIEVPKEWCMRMAMLEVETGADMEAGVQAPEAAKPETERAELPPLPKAVREMIKTHQPAEDNEWTVTSSHYTADQMRDYARAALLAADSKAGGEPYAYAVYFPDQQREELVHYLGVLLEDMTNYEHVVTNLYTRPQQQAEPLTDGQELWLWQNGDHMLAFRHLYPCFTPGGDPMTLGEPAGRAVFRESHDRAARSAGKDQA